MHPSGLPFCRLKTVIKVLMAGAALILAGSSPAQTPTPSPGTSKPGEVKIVGPGLTLLRYGLHPSQVKADKGTGYVHYSQFGKVVKAPKTLTSISNWKKPVEENAVLTGYLEIEKDGEYHFRTDSDWDRNELIVDGKIVCPFRDGSNKAGSVQLKAGLVPIVSVAYVIETKDTRVQWMPPGKTEWSDIPNKALKRTNVELAK